MAYRARFLLLVAVACVVADASIVDTSSDARVIFQMGHDRTGTTFQFQVLCAAACLAHPDEPVTCEFVAKLSDVSASPDKVQVLKTHGASLALSGRREIPTSRLFVTANSTESEDWATTRDNMQKKLRVPIEYVQNFDRLLLEGHAMAFDYGKLFGLDDTHTNALVSYMKYWEILRRCCGSQMSADYRDRIQGRPNHRSVDEYGYDMCEGYDIAGIEKLIMETEVFRQCRRIHRIGAASAVDLQFDGTYCARAQYATATYGWKFNDPRYHKELNPLLKDQAKYTPPSTPATTPTN